MFAYAMGKWPFSVEAAGSDISLSDRAIRTPSMQYEDWKGAAMGAADQGQVQVSFRLPADLATKLEQVAEEQDRTVSAEIRRVIRSHVTETEDDQLSEAA
jgi:hypothetical protein